MTYRTLWKLLIEREDLIWEVPVDCARGVKDCISVCYWQIVKILFCWVSVSDCFIHLPFGFSVDMLLQDLEKDTEKL